MRLRVLDLFSGIGGFSLGLERTGGFETVAFCEIEEFPRKVLKKHWPQVQCFEDVRTLRGEDIGPVDVICGGYPCQPFSTAGKRRGQKDDRHLWPEFNRLVAEIRPTWVIGENVAGHISMGLDDVLSDLERQGYSARTFVIPACAVGAPHRRDRCWTIAHSNNVLHARELDTGTDCRASSRGESCDEHKGQAPHRQRVWVKPGTSGEDVANATSKRQQKSREPVKRMRRSAEKTRQANFSFDAVGRGIKPTICRGDNGFSGRVDRLKALGNAVVPQIPEMIGHAILEAESRIPKGDTTVTDISKEAVAAIEALKEQTND